MGSNTLTPPCSGAFSRSFKRTPAWATFQWILFTRVLLRYSLDIDKDRRQRCCNLPAKCLARAAQFIGRKMRNFSSEDPCSKSSSGSANKFAGEISQDCYSFNSPDNISPTPESPGGGPVCGSPLFKRMSFSQSTESEFGSKEHQTSDEPKIHDVVASLVISENQHGAVCLH